MIKRVPWTSVWFEAGGAKREVHGLPLTQRRRFIALQTLLSEIVTAHPGLTLGFLYDHDRDFASALDETLGLFGLKPDWISGEQATQLLFAHEGGPGLLWQLEFPDRPEVEGRLLNPETDPYHAAIAALWSHMPAATLEEVIETASSITWADVEGILAERNRLTQEADPEFQKKREEEQQMASLRKAIEDLDFSTFGDGLEVGRK